MWLVYRCSTLMATAARHGDEGKPRCATPIKPIVTVATNDVRTAILRTRFAGD
jgi:hypothetical protein